MHLLFFTPILANLIWIGGGGGLVVLIIVLVLVLR